MGKTSPSRRNCSRISIIFISQSRAKRKGPKNRANSDGNDGYRLGMAETRRVMKAQKSLRHVLPSDKVLFNLVIEKSSMGENERPEMITYFDGYDSVISRDASWRSSPSSRSRLLFLFSAHVKRRRDVGAQHSYTN
jgi:hypothetical protein